MLSNLIHEALWKLTEKYPNRTRDIDVDGLKYLRRFYLTPRRKDEFGEETGKSLGFGVYLHYFYRGDEERQLHNHPWEKSISFILSSGYLEERKTKDDEVELRNIRPFWQAPCVWQWFSKSKYYNVIDKNDFHRVIKKQKSPHVWTLFITGKRAQEWGFWDRDTKQYTHFEDVVKQSEQGYKQK